MNYKHGNRIVKAWQISKSDSIKSDLDVWVREAFQNKEIFWGDDSRSVSPALLSIFSKKELVFQNKAKVQGLIVPSAFVNNIGLEGDYLIFDTQADSRFFIVSEKEFEKEFFLVG
ncbi:MAG: hypothetical protein LBI43_02635 [Streptococcaceae bacterium]|jgi:hypothetical protein|nr:hypothetical protein [Streptococcaceae bacterium]